LCEAHGTGLGASKRGRATKGEAIMAAMHELSAAELAQVEGGYQIHLENVLVSLILP
jgi:bacteriocin-like protein